METVQRKARILVVDDAKVTLAVFSKYLELPEFEVKTADSAETGLKIAEEYNPDIIISDMVMPGMSGIAFCHEVRKRPIFANLIFLLMSAVRIESADAVEALSSGADDFIVKNTEKEEIIAKVKAFLRIKFLQDEIRSSNRKLSETIANLHSTKDTLELKNQELQQEKERLNQSLQHISNLTKQLEEKNVKLEEYAKGHEENLESIIKLLSTLIESRRQYHRGHAKEVAEISTFIARKMELNEEEIKHVYVAALLHEIGKFGIPDELAMKNPLDYNDDEKLLLKKHPVIGASLLSEYFGENNQAVKMIRHLYERVDGLGVPDKLQKEDIPVGSRIIAVANRFDNLYNRSSVREPEKAIDILEELAGSRFDHRVINYVRDWISENNLTPEARYDKLTIFDLKPGMTLASDIYTKSGIKLYSKEYELDDHSINNIIKYDKIDPIVEDIFIKG